MTRATLFALVLFALAPLVQAHEEKADEERAREAQTNDDWRHPDSQNLLELKLATGSVWIELAPQFAPQHVANIKHLVRQRFFDQTSIIRVQENYVVQWGDPKAETKEAVPFAKAKKNVGVEFFRDLDEVSFQAIDSRDAYADKVGFVDGFPAASDGKRVWLAHCYGMVGVSRAMEADSGNGSGLYVVIGHAPRHLDRNVTLVGRVLSGMSLLTTLPRGTGSLGFYETQDELVPITSMRLAADADTRFEQQIMKTDSLAFGEHVTKRTTRSEDWFLEPTGRIELCNVGVPQRTVPASSSSGG